MKNFLKIILLSFITASLTANSFAKSPPPQGFADIVKPLFPAVVNISTSKKKSKRVYQNKQMNRKPFPKGSPFEEFNQFFEQFQMPNKNLDEENDRKHYYLGSGFIIDKKGYIVTNNHVINEADEITVTLSSGKQLKATVVGSDKKTDLALLKVKSHKPLPFVKFGDSDKSRVGDWIIAIGNPFGLGGSVTAGIISAHERDIQPDGLVDNFIQTDAAINRGNSGGPMFNMQGEVIGINTAILSPSGVYIGIGFATPSSVAKIVIEQLKTNKKVTRGMLGVKIQQLTEDIAEPLGLKENDGALVVEVMPGGAADKHGIKTGDVITHFDNTKIDSVRKLSRVVAESPVNKKLIAKVIRNGSKKNISVLLSAGSHSTKKDKSLDDYKNIDGADFANLNNILRGKYNIPGDTKGVVIVSLEQPSIWAKRGFAVGDVIVSVNQQKVNTVSKLSEIISRSKLLKRKSVLLLVVREGNSLFVPLNLK